SLGPGSAGRERRGWAAIKIPHRCGQRFVLQIKIVRHAPGKWSKGLVRCVDLHFGIDAEQMRKTAGVVGMTVRNYHKVQLTKIHLKSLQVALKYLAIVSRIEQYPLVSILN